jgi:hypothetical protein
MSPQEDCWAETLDPAVLRRQRYAWLYDDEDIWAPQPDEAVTH